MTVWDDYAAMGVGGIPERAPRDDRPDPPVEAIDPPEHEQREFAAERLADVLVPEAPATNRLDEELWHRVAQTERLADEL